MKTTTTLGALALAVLGTVGSAQASQTFDLANNFNGDSPSGSPTWMTATFADTLTAGEVKLTLKTSLQDPDEFIRSFWFNTVPTHDGLIAIKPGSKVDIIGTVAPGALQIGAQSPGNWDFDYGIDFPTANNSGRFNANEEFSIILTSSALGDILDETDFVSPDGIKRNNPLALYVGAKVQGIPGDKSGEIGDENPPCVDCGGDIPEPASLSILGLGAAGLLLRRRKA